MSATKLDTSKMSVAELRQFAIQLNEVLYGHTTTSLDALKKAIEKALAGVDQQIPVNYQIDIRITNGNDGKFAIAVFAFKPIVNGQTKPAAATTPAPSAPVVNAGVQNGNGGNGKFQGTNALIKYAAVHKVDISAYCDIPGKVNTGVNAFRVLKELNPSWKGIQNDVILAQIQAM